MTLNESLSVYTEQLRHQGLLRTRRLVKEHDKNLVYFDSNDYLLLRQDKVLSAAYQKGFALFPIGSGGSMLLSGYHANHQKVERAFAEFLGVDDCILFSSGYAANLSLATLLGKLNAVCVIDKGVHASVYDGLKLAEIPYQRFLHNDMEDLAQQLSKLSTNSAVLTEGLFSMSGQCAPLDTISKLCNKTNAVLLVDEAHSFGVLGLNGRGATASHQLSQAEVPLRMIALGKAFGAQGALVAGCGRWIEALLQAGRSLIYSTAVSPAMSYGFMSSLEAVAMADEKREYLSGLIKQFRACINKSPMKWANSHSPIQQLQLGSVAQALLVVERLRQRGFICSAIRPPTVAPKYAGLRIVLNSGHCEEQINKLFCLLEELYDYSPA